MLTRIYLVTMSLLLSLAGCGDNSPSMRVWGKVQYDGQPIQDGQIIFFPLENTKSPSTGGKIQQGKYDIPQHQGPYQGGAYRVEITAYGDRKTYTPNASGTGLTATVRDQFLPAQYNQQSTLTVTISSRSDGNEHDFDLAP